MNLGREQIPPVLARARERFESALASAGANRGFRAEKKGDAGQLFVYDFIGKDPWFGGGIDHNDVLAELDAMRGVKRLDVYINSPGGDVWAGKTIYNQLKRFPAEKVVHVDGIAASAASLIAMAGDRIVTEAGGTWLVHRVAAGMWGFSEDLRKKADEIDAETDAILGIYEQRTGRAAADILAWMREDAIVDAVTAKARGWTDEISEADQRRANAQAKAAANAPAPRAKTSAEIVAEARANYSDLRTRFPAASRGSQPPGQPGARNATQTPGNRLENK